MAGAFEPRRGTIGTRTRALTGISVTGWIGWRKHTYGSELFQKRRRAGTEHAHLMYPAADNITAEEIRAVAAYYASLQPAAPAPAPAQ